MVNLIKEVASHMEQKATFPTSIEVPFGTSTRAVLLAAVEEADRLRHHELDTQHLLLGLLRIADTIPASILSQHDVTLEAARASL
jgi:ATP-dependent Clp protease ATP-binding subunit ClpC